MRVKSTLSSLAFAAILSGGSAVAAERTVKIMVGGETVVGTLNVPEAGSPPPVVLMLHGFTGTRDELPVAGTDEGVYALTARQFAEKGIASLRIDFRGSGESAGEWADTTFSGQTADAVEAIDWLKTAEGVDGDRIAILGWSQGGLAGAHAAAQRPEVKSVVLWAPVVEPMATFGGLLGADLVASASVGDPNEVHTATLPWGVDTQLKGAFFAEVTTTKTADAIADYKGPLLVIVGTKDDLVFPQPEMGQKLIDAHEGDEKIAVFETGHVWGAFEGPDMLTDNMVPTSVEWLSTYF